MNFKKDVIERSRTLPVVVDFWAPWCGPCRVLGPVIEQLAGENGGKWELVKVNTEEHQELGVEYGIRSIPNVKMFHKGDVIGEFAGALPKHQILQWLDKVLPDPQKAAWAEVGDHADSVSQPEAIELLKTFLKENPNHREASVALARRLAFYDPDHAVQLLSIIKMGDPEYELVEDVTQLKELINLTDHEQDNLSLKLLAAAQDLKDNNLEVAVQKIIEVVGLDKNLHNELPRRAAIAIFHLIGSQHPVTKKYRRLFDMALY